MTEHNYHMEFVKYSPGQERELFPWHTKVQQGSYLIHCWLGMALCAGLETSKFPPSKSTPELQSHRTTPFFILFFSGFTTDIPLLLPLCCRGWKGILPSPPWRDKLAELGTNRGNGVERINFNNQIISPQALSEARHNFRPCLKSSR